MDSGLDRRVGSFECVIENEIYSRNVAERDGSMFIGCNQREHSE